MKHAKAKASDRGVAAEPAMADVVMNGTTPKGAAASTVRFGSTSSARLHPSKASCAATYRQVRRAFTVCRVQLRVREVFDIRRASSKRRAPRVISEWLDVVSPIDTG